MLCGQVREEVYAAEALHVFEWAVVTEVVAPLALKMATEAAALAAAEIPRIQRSLCGNIDRKVLFLMPNGLDVAASPINCSVFFPWIHPCLSRHCLRGR